MATKRGPNIRQNCRMCNGPIYDDEPKSTTCPDCCIAVRFINEAHSMPKPEQLQRAERPVRVRIRKVASGAVYRSEDDR